MSDKPQPVDWEAARRRLQQSQLALEKGLADDPCFVEETYRRRAERLARPETLKGGPEGESTVLVFAVGSDRYAVALRQVREVVEAPGITPVPGSPAELAGVLNVRGQIEPVWETSVLLGLSPPAGRASGFAVLLRGQNVRGALRVDLVLQMRSPRPAEWQRPEQSSPYAKGVTSDGVTLIDAEALLEPLLEQGGVG